MYIYLRDIILVVHPNDDVNMSQSSNDAFRPAMHIASALKITKNYFQQFIIYDYCTPLSRLHVMNKSKVYFPLQIG
jgi:hypothetical protein